MHESLLKSNEYTDGDSLSYLLLRYRLSQKNTQNLISTTGNSEVASLVNDSN